MLRQLRVTLFILPFFLLAGGAGGEVPAGYYSTVDTSSPARLRTTLHSVIEDHLVVPYDSEAVSDTWEVLEIADEDPLDRNHVRDVYGNKSFRKVDDRSDGSGPGGYNREHTWPSSYGFPEKTATPYSDCHALFLADAGYNSSRSNLPFRFCHADCNEKTTEIHGEEGGGEGVYPGWSNWQLGRGADGAWETWYGRRGDVARALFYMDVRYEGGFGGGKAEPDLVLTDDLDLLVSDVSNGAPVAYMGRLSDLLVWHRQDPVDDRERHHNETVYDHQHNRNPFVDHPEWVDVAYGATTGGASPVLALHEQRFRITVRWETSRGETGSGTPQRLTDDSGYFWFFRDSNIELMVKVLDGCSVNDRFWVFAAGLTNVGVTLTVEDTEAGRSRTYRNAVDSPYLPVQDTGAFATCDGPSEDDCPECTRICYTGQSKACGDSCISLDKNCHQPPGTACNEADVPAHCL